MAVGITIGGILGRRTPGWIYLLYAVTLMLAWNPGYATDLAFQLSASATAGVIVLAPALRDATLARLRLASSGVRAAAIELAATATGAAVAVVPVQVAAFERLSLWTIPANILVAPLYEATLLVAFVAAFVGFAAGVAEVFQTAGGLVPNGFLLVTRFVSAWPSAELTLRAPLLAGVAWVTLLAAATWLLARLGRNASPLDPGRPGVGTPLLLSVLAVGLWLLVATPSSNEARVTVFDVGQGLAVLVEDRGAAVLIDTGPPDGSLLGALGARPTGGIDAVLVTHADADHSGGLPELARRRRLGAVLASPATLAATDLEGARALDIGDRLTLSERTSIEVLSPPVATALPAHEERNDGSLVLLVTIGTRRILLTADIEQSAESWLVDSGLPLRADALVVPRHGSRSSSTLAFVEAVHPAVAVISVGASNPFGHPAPEVLERYKDALLFRTDEDGDVTFTSDGVELRVESERRSD
jgi:competence protein ComEC